MDTPEEKMYRYAESQYYRMAGAAGLKVASQRTLCLMSYHGALLQIKSITLIHNRRLQNAFDNRRAKLEKSVRDNVILAFHGTSEQAIDTIAKDNFDVARLASNTGIRP